MLGFRRALVAILFLFSIALAAEDFYKLLAVDKKASDKEIKKAYRTLSKRFHPDKNPGDDTAHRKFADIAEAYDALSDPETRKIYDQHGHEGLQRHRQGGSARPHDPFDLFSRFFGGGGHFGGGGQRRGPDMEVRISIPLKDFYLGNTHEISLEKQHICEDCDGSGSADGKVDTCSTCQGHGVVVKKHQLAPGIFQQMQMKCDRCQGKGKINTKPCKTCKGSRVIKKMTTFSLDVEKGLPRGGRVTYENEADASPDWEAGDLIVHVEELGPRIDKETDVRNDGTFFRRKGHDLYWREVLSLREAWMGDWSRNITHLDGHIIRLARRQDETVHPGSIETLEGEGMPLPIELREQEGKEFGSLYIEYSLLLPDQMAPKSKAKFRKVWDDLKGERAEGLDSRLGRVHQTRHDEL